MDRDSLVLYISYMASPGIEENGLRPPQYLDEAEALVGLPAYTDPDTEERLINGELLASPAELGARALLYTNSLRVLAKARNKDRQHTENLDAQTFNDQWALTLTAKGIAQIAQAHAAELAPVVRQLRMRHNIEHFLQNQTSFAGLRAHQYPYLKSIAEFLQRGPAEAKYINRFGQVIRFLVQGGVVVAPTGLGKTVMIARTVQGLGIGEKAAERAGEGERLRALIIVPTQDLVRQFKGEIGDDSFRRFAPDVTVGGYYRDEKEDGLDVTVLTQNKFLDDFRDGRLNQNAFDIAFIDEAHHLTAGKLLEAFRRHWKGPVLGFTATPDYSPSKDVQTLLPHVIYHGDALSYMNEGFLNDGQLFSFRVDPRQHRELLSEGINLEDPRQRLEAGETLMNRSVVELAVQLLKEGRRGMIFCGYGGKALHARTMADLLSEAVEPDGERVVLPDGKYIRAEATGSFRTEERRELTNEEIRHAYNRGDVHVITTTDMGREGLNAEIDFVIIAGRISSLLKLKQIVGRGTRLSERFPVTVYAHFFKAPEGTEPHTRTLYEAFGLERVKQGECVGRPLNVWKPAPRRFSNSLERMSAQINLMPVSKAVASKKEEIEVPEDYVSSFEMAEAASYAVSSVGKLLDRNGFKWVGRSEERDGERTFVRYYEPAAYDFLKEHIRLPIKTKEMLSVKTFAKKLGVTRGFLNECIADLAEQREITVKLRRANGTGEGTYLDLSDQAKVEQYAQKITAKATDMTCADIARHANILSSGEAKRLMTSEEAEQSQEKYVWRGDEARTGRFKTNVWSQEAGRQIAERLRGRNKSLPPHLLNLATIASALPVHRRVAYTYLKSLESDPERLNLYGDGAKTTCFSWSSLRTALERYDCALGFKVDFERLPRRGEADSERIAYARGVQYLLMADPKRLGLGPEDLELAKKMADKIKRGEI